MNVSILNFDSPCGKEFKKLCESIKVSDSATTEAFIKTGFTNYSKPNLYLCRCIPNSSNYPVTFNMTIDKESLQIKDISILDENFLQPYFCNQNELDYAKSVINKLVSKNLLEKI